MLPIWSIFHVHQTTNFLFRFMLWNSSRPMHFTLLFNNSCIWDEGNFVCGHRSHGRSPCKSQPWSSCKYNFVTIVRFPLPIFNLLGLRMGWREHHFIFVLLGVRHPPSRSGTISQEIWPQMVYKRCHVCKLIVLYFNPRNGPSWFLWRHDKQNNSGLRPRLPLSLLPHAARQMGATLRKIALRNLRLCR